MDAPGSSGLQFELNNLRNELRAKQREHTETEEEVKPCCQVLHGTLSPGNAVEPCWQSQNLNNDFEQ